MRPHGRRVTGAIVEKGEIPHILAFEHALLARPVLRQLLVRRVLHIVTVLILILPHMLQLLRSQLRMRLGCLLSVLHLLRVLRMQALALLPIIILQ